jgi:hypothetical protein
MRCNLNFFLLLVLIFLAGCKNRPSESQEKWQSLFNGKDLLGWETYLGPKYDTILKKWDTVPVGLNVDPLQVFGVAEIDGGKVIRISGEQFGGMNTLQEFENYHFQFQFRWGRLQWPPRESDKRDGGLMYHAVGAQGADGGFWMRSHEFQIEEGDCGDYWACAGAVFDVNSIMEKDSSYVYRKEGESHTFSTVSPLGRNCKKFPDAEKPTGEWNTIDLYCFGGTSVHMINGVVNMILRNSRQLEGGSEVPLTKGKIQFESEGAEMFIRNLQISSIEKIPEKLME